MGFWHLIESHEFMRERLINFITQASKTVNGILVLQLFQIIGNAKSGSFLAKLESQRFINRFIVGYLNIIYSEALW